MKVKSVIFIYQDIQNWINSFNMWITQNSLNHDNFLFEILNSSMSVIGYKFILSYSIKNISIKYEIDTNETLIAMQRFEQNYVQSFKQEVLS